LIIRDWPFLQSRLIFASCHTVFRYLNMQSTFNYNTLNRLLTCFPFFRLSWPQPRDNSSKRQMASDDSKRFRSSCQKLGPELNVCRDETSHRTCPDSENRISGSPELINFSEPSHLLFSTDSAVSPASKSNFRLRSWPTARTWAKNRVSNRSLVM